MRNPNSTRVILGLAFVFTGALLLIRLTNISLPFDLPDFLFTWPMILIVLGAFFFFTRENRTTGVILFVIGAVFLLQFEFGIKTKTIIQYAVPVILLAAGAALIFPRKYGKKKGLFSREIKDSADSLHAVHIFSGGTRRINSESFQGGEVVCIFGGAEVYFNDTILEQGGAVLNVTCIFGGCEISVPDDWTIRTETTTILAGIEDKRHKLRSSRQPDPEKVLIIKGTLLFSGLEIKVN